MFLSQTGVGRGRSGGRGGGRGRGREGVAHEADALSECEDEQDAAAAAPEGGEEPPQDEGLPQEEEPAQFTAAQVPANILTELHRLFAASDHAKLESMCWWLCSARCDPLKPRLQAILVTEHASTSATVELTSTGTTQLGDWLAKNPGFKIFAWCHSHHAGLLRLASTADLKQQYNFHLSERPNQMLMVIVWRRGVESRGGFSVQRLMPSRFEELSRASGNINTALHEVREFLEDVPIEEVPGESVRVIRLGGLVAGDVATSSAAETRPAIASLASCTSAEVLEHLRRRRDDAGSSRLPVKDWLPTLPVPAGISTIERTEARVKEALQSLRSSGHIRLEFPVRGCAGRDRLLSATVVLL